MLFREAEKTGRHLWAWNRHGGWMAVKDEED